MKRALSCILPASIAFATVATAVAGSIEAGDRLEMAAVLEPMPEG
jgi:hypothetical protein